MNMRRFIAKPMYIHPAFIAICGGDGTAAIVLSYLYERCENGPAQIAQTEMMADIPLSRAATNRVRGLLKRAGYTEEHNRAVQQTIVYMVNYDVVDAEILKWLSDEDYQHVSLMEKDCGEGEDG